jgi:uncharacterized protein (UPF0264 family)
MLGIGFDSRGIFPRASPTAGSRRLLVSVARAEELAAALAGSAGVLDVKDPARGSLGAASPEIVRLARAVAPASVAVSAALGDRLPRGRRGAEALGALGLELARAGASFLKVGLAGADGSPRTARALLDLRERLAEGPSLPAVIAVAFADDPAPALRPLDLPALAAGAGLQGAMLDTLAKERSILDLMGEAELRAWVAEVRGAGLLCGLAGSLTLEHLPRAAALGPDVVGVRGAVCEGGRTGRLSEELVRLAARAISTHDVSADRPASACV